MIVSASVTTKSYNGRLVLIFLLCTTLAAVVKRASCVAIANATMELQESSHDNANHTSAPTAPSKSSSAATFASLESALDALANVTETPVQQQNATTVKANNSNKRTCACDDTESEPMCASNGITYKNTCRFECAKARVTRLRLVKQGQCTKAAGAQTYWQSSQKSG